MDFNAEEVQIRSSQSRVDISDSEPLTVDFPTGTNPQPPTAVSPETHPDIPDPSLSANVSWRHPCLSLSFNTPFGGILNPEFDAVRPGGVSRSISSESAVGTDASLSHDSASVLRFDSLEEQEADFSCHAVTTPVVPPTLPPSVEEAYKKKCIELKRRMNEVEESNDVYRLRKVRLERGIRKMRLERAFLLEILGKRMRKNGSGGNGPQGFYDEESEGSSEGPPTPLEKPLRSKRSHRRPVPSPPASVTQQLSISNQSFQQAFPPHHQEVPFPTIGTTNGTANVHIASQMTSFPRTSNSNHVSSESHPVSEVTPFQEFFATRYAAHPERYPECRGNEAELLSLAHQTWEEMGEPGAEPWNARYEQRHSAPVMERDESMRGRGRERERERQREREREREREPEREREREVEMTRERDVEMEMEGPTGSGGGFTAVNG